MADESFLKWMSSETPTEWWNDSGDPDEVRAAIGNGAAGVTLNPFLVKLALDARRDFWTPKLGGVLDWPGGAAKAEEIVRIVSSEIAKIVNSVFERTRGASGRVCAQVDPARAHDTAYMVEMAKRLHAWAPNIAVKLPATNAALDALEECVALGMTVVMTLGFTVSQVLAVAERYERARAEVTARGITPGKCYAVVMIGRLDDYLREAAADCRSRAAEEDILGAGVAVVKRAWGIFRERSYAATLLPSGLRRPTQAAALAGGDLLLSVGPKIQEGCAAFKGPFREGFSTPPAKDSIERLLTIRDFARAYEPDGLKPDEFIGFAPTQRTLTQFIEAGWKPLEAFGR